MEQQMTDPIINIMGEKVALGPLQRSHVPLYERWLNDFELATTYFLGDLRPGHYEDLNERYDRLVRDVTFTIYECASMRPIGITGLDSVHHYNRTANFGILIGEKRCWGKGYGTEATRLTLDWGFHGLGLHNILLTVFDYNRRGINAYLRAGFKLIGRQREAKRLAGRAYDVVYMDALATEFTDSVLSPMLPHATE